jgi:hypothetical protein
MTPEEIDNRYIAELARVTGTSVPLVNKIVEVQLAMVMRDLGLSGEAQTLIGKVKLIKGTLILVDPSSHLQRMLDKSRLVDRLMKELGEE